jgi:hypothetical protein
MRVLGLLIATILVTGCLENTPSTSNEAAQQLSNGLDFTNGNFAAPRSTPTNTTTTTNTNTNTNTNTSTNSNTTNSQTTVTFL